MKRTQADYATVAAALPYEQHAEDIVMTHCNQTIRFNADMLYARIDGNELTMELPAMAFSGDILSSTARESFRDAGLTERDIDDAIETLLEGLQVKQLAALLLKARR